MAHSSRARARLIKVLESTMLSVSGIAPRISTRPWVIAYTTRASAHSPNPSLRRGRMTARASAMAVVATMLITRIVAVSRGGMTAMMGDAEGAGTPCASVVRM